MGLQILIIAIASIIMTQIAIFSTSIYLHRTLAHRALSLRPAIEFVFRLALWLVTGGDRQQWVAVHRKHHTFTDKEGDPHSPKLLGFWKVQLWNVYYYIQEARKPQTIAKFAPDVAPVQVPTPMTVVAELPNGPTVVAPAGVVLPGLLALFAA